MGGRRVSNQRRDIGTEEVLYRVGLVAALVAATGFLVYSLGPQEQRDFLHRYSFCVIYRFTGFYCPGCGGSRAVSELLRGNLLASLLYHPLAAYGLVLYIAFMGSHMAAHVTAWLRSRTGTGAGDGPRLRSLRWRTSFITAAVVLLIGNFVIKNVIHLVTGVDILARLDQIFLP